ncbi:MAG: hypothetical protein QF463_06135 [Vicinamibacterales bacterium]|mgnify:CR=1 FL=1|jgi:hypothetical protein|nr:hypothetical protein [Acidobacteriota bacterium]MDP6372325.1 hypothetical protein [Vicinamibacterales bacterium]MDP6608628.1 hypothetical protein [Vicinamibacterales bacterium]HAK54406.1 hypothetical protein [Acidobacteriota bacterium]|tara:strand:- start:3912 stop:4916 length:1005 start_codon:yes stop_codon:yes gene_type:complete
MPVHHVVYGLVVRANRAVPGLLSGTASASVDVEMHVGEWPDRPSASPPNDQAWFRSDTPDGEPAALTVWRLDDGGFFWMRYADGTEFLLSQRGDAVWARWAPASTVEDTATYLLGPVLGFLLRLRGTVCLHASAVVVDDQAIALVGPPGAGKSTTAAALARRGVAVLSDDVVALVERDPGWVVEAGYPCVRMRPEAVRTMFDSLDALPLMTPTWDRRYIDLTERPYRFGAEATPLGGVCILDERRDEADLPRIEPMTAKDALMALVENAYTSYLLDRTMRAREFVVFGDVVARVPVWRLVPHADPSRLPALCDVVTRDDRITTGTDDASSAQYA